MGLRAVSPRDPDTPSTSTVTEGETDTITYSCTACDAFEIDARDHSEAECWAALCAHQLAEHPKTLARAEVPS